MPSKQTTNYKLNQWVKTDKVLMDDFNADNQKIDAAIKALDTKADGKASTSALISLSSRVDALASTVAGQGSTLERKGNCQVVVTSYVGDGGKTRTHTFTKKPLMIFISGECQMTLPYGCTLTYNHESSTYAVGAVWSGNSVTLSSKTSVTQSDARVIANYYGTTYQMTVLYDQSQ